MGPSLTHLGGNLLCVIDVESTGLEPGYNEITQITIMPLDKDFEPHPTYPTFNQLIVPEHPERLYSGASKMARGILRRALDQGVSAYDASGVFEIWFDRLQLNGGRISPLAQNWPYDAAMILHWLGCEFFYHSFHGHYRDLMCVASYINDRDAEYGNSVTFNQLRLAAIASYLDVPYDKACLHDSYYDCKLTARCYKKILTHPLPL